MSSTTPTTAITATPPADPVEAAAHFASLLNLETDCADVNQAFDQAESSGAPRGAGLDFTLLDVRSPQAFDAAHIAGAINLPQRDIDEAALSPFAADTTFVVYCAGPHCNGADKAALRLAQLGRPVKKMIGGVTGWLDEGLTLYSPQQGSHE